jgi:hypothetical protein
MTREQKVNSTGAGNLEQLVTADHVVSASPRCRMQGQRVVRDEYDW